MHVHSSAPRFTPPAPSQPVGIGVAPVITTPPSSTIGGTVVAQSGPTKQAPHHKPTHHKQPPLTNEQIHAQLEAELARLKQDAALASYKAYQQANPINTKPMPPASWGFVQG